jgi:hypothetical protein
MLVRKLSQEQVEQDLVESLDYSYEEEYEDPGYGSLDEYSFMHGVMVLGLMGYDTEDMSREELISEIERHPTYLNLVPSVSVYGRWVHVLRQTDSSKLVTAANSFITTTKTEICVTDANKAEFWNFSEYRRFGLVFEGICRVLWNADMFSVVNSEGKLEAIGTQTEHLDTMTEGWVSLNDVTFVGVRVKDDENLYKDIDKIQAEINKLGVVWDNGEQVEKQIVGLELIDVDEAQEFYEIPYDSEEFAASDNPEVLYEETDSGKMYYEEVQKSLLDGVKEGDVESVKLALENGADVHADNDLALQWAPKYGYTEVVKLLLENGADVHADNDSALQLASRYGHAEIVKLLLEYGADVHAENDSALRWASENGYTEIVKLLLENGANVHADSDYALQWASANGHTEIVKLLQDHIAKEKKPSKKNKPSKKPKTSSNTLPDISYSSIIRSVMKPLQTPCERKHAMLTLDEAIERAKLMCDDSMLLNNQSYDLLVGKLEEEDIYPFTMALVERGIVVRTAKLDSHSSQKSIEEKLVKSAQSFTQQSPGGLWLPDSLDDPLPEEDFEDLPEDGEYESFLPSTPFTWPTVDAPNMEEESIRSALEQAGVRVMPDGKVEMYRQNIPGIYTTKLPQGPLPLETAIKFYDQMLDSTDKEQTRLDTLLDLLTRLSGHTQGIEASLEELTNYKFSPMSRSKSTQAISQGLATVKDLGGRGEWAAAEKALDSLRDTLAEYEGERGEAYDSSLAIVDALDRLAELQNSDPEAYQRVIQGLGGMPMAARKRCVGDRYNDVYPEDADFLRIVVSTSYLEDLWKSGDAPDEMLEYYVPLSDGIDILTKYSGSSPFAWSRGISAEFDVIESAERVFRGTGEYIYLRSPATFYHPEEWDEYEEEFDFLDDEYGDMKETLDEFIGDVCWEGFKNKSINAEEGSKIEPRRSMRYRMAQLTQPDFMIPVDSSNVQEFGYVPEDQTLWVRFLDKGRGSSLYVYLEVEPDIYQQFMASPSKGKFIWTHLRDRYPYERVE